MAAAARTKGIPCLLVPHGYALKNLPAEDILDNMYLPLFDQTTKKVFVASGVPARQVRVTGPAMYDAIVKYKRRRSKRRSAITSKNILLLTQPLVEDNLMAEDQFFKLVETIVKEMMKIAGATIVIKLHPRERGWQRYQKIIKHLQKKTGGEAEGNKIFLYQRGESDLLYRLLKQADAVVNFYATAGVLEASILDVPAITFPFDGQKSNKYGDFDPSLYVWTIEAFKPALEQLLQNPALLREKRRKMVQKFCSAVDGKASQRIVQWAYELLSSNYFPPKRTST
jgi:glycosyltransferase involved in cell wall biosynthesis